MRTKLLYGTLVVATGMAMGATASHADDRAKLDGIQEATTSRSYGIIIMALSHRFNKNLPIPGGHSVRRCGIRLANDAKADVVDSLGGGVV